MFSGLAAGHAGGTAHTQQQQASAELTGRQTALDAEKTQRQALLVGQSVHIVSAQLAQALTSAKTASDLGQQQHHSSQQTQIRQQEALTQARTQQAALAHALHLAQSALSDWVADYNRRPTSETPDTLDLLTLYTRLAPPRVADPGTPAHRHPGQRRAPRPHRAATAH